MHKRKSPIGHQSQREFRGRNLLQIALPLGGIGTGCICLNGYGGLQDFSIRHAPATQAEPDRHSPKDAAFALLRLPSIGKTRLVEGPFPYEKVYDQGLKSQGYNGGGFEGLPRFRECAFKGEYPLGEVQLSDTEIPVEVKITGFNPFIPLDDINSGLPCAILEYTLKNQSKDLIPYQFSYHLSHLAHQVGATSSRSQVIPGTGVFFYNEEPPEAASFGSAALGVVGAEAVIKGHWFSGGWFDAISALWREVSTGNFQPKPGRQTEGYTGRNGGSILIEGKLAAGQQVTYPIVITWHFPNIVSEGKEANSCRQPRSKPFYSTQWEDARQVLFYVRDHYESLRQRTQAFHDALFNSTLPAYVLDAVSANLGILKSPTVLRHVDGGIWAWEGCFSNRGCCEGSCTHVWNYAQAMPHLFPALERTLRENELERSMNEVGHVVFRAPLPGCQATHDFHAAADGQLGGIMKVYREWQIYGDRTWLRRMYPLAKASMDFCIENWDPRHHGLVEEPHNNTYDIEFWGPDGMCTSFYLGALTAMAALARAVGHPQQAIFYEKLAQEGAQRMDEELFNGEYYQQNIKYEGLRETSFIKMLAALGGEMTDEERLLKAEGPKYQYGSGCLSDGVLGAWLTALSGLASPLSSENIRQHLKAVYQHNFKTSLWEHANVQRPGYAIGDEPGLLLCTWPRGGKPTLPFVYSDEVWTGIEYQVASHLIWEGLIQEGLNIVRAARSRYDGWKRNPWNEYECGNYYARAMASYALLITLSGFHYSAANHSLSIAPRLTDEPFQFFFSTASGWGSVKFREGKLEIELLEGSLQVDRLSVTWNGRTQTFQPGWHIKAGEKVHQLLEKMD